MFFCGNRGSYVWSKYHRAPGDTVLLRAGTLDDPAQRAFESFYDPAAVWPAESLTRWRTNMKPR